MWPWPCVVASFGVLFVLTSKLDWPLSLLEYDIDPSIDLRVQVQIALKVSTLANMMLSLRPLMKVVS